MALTVDKVVDPWSVARSEACISACDEAACNRGGNMGHALKKIRVWFVAWDSELLSGGVSFGFVPYCEITTA